MSNLLRKKVLFMLTTMFPLLANAQSTHQLDSMLAEIITKVPKKDQANLEYIRAHYFDTLSLAETDSTDQKNLYARFYFSFADSSYDFSQLYYRPESVKPYITYQKKGNLSERLTYVYHHSEMTQKKLIKAHQQSKSVASMPYRKEQTYGTGCLCYRGIALMRLKQQVKRERAQELQTRYAISIYRVNSVTKIVVEIPPKNPQFTVDVSCGMYY